MTNRSSRPIGKSYNNLRICNFSRFQRNVIGMIVLRLFVGFFRTPLHAPHKRRFRRHPEPSEGRRSMRLSSSRWWCTAGCRGFSAILTKTAVGTNDAWLGLAKLAKLAKFCKFLAGSFSAVSKRNFAGKYAFDSIFQDLQDLHTFAPLQSQNFRRNRFEKSEIFVKIQQHFCKCASQNLQKFAN